MSHSSAPAGEKVMSNQSRPSSKTQSKTLNSAEKKSGNAQDRQQMIATAAYFRAERRGFDGADPVVDWLAAEAEVDEMFKDYKDINVH